MRYVEIVIENQLSDIAPGTVRTKKVKLKDGRVAVLKIERVSAGAEEDDASEHVSVDAHVDGAFVGCATFYQNTKFTDSWDAKLQNTWTASNLNINDEFRRLGIATEMYALATACGMRIIPSGKGVYCSGSGKLLPDGEKFWSKQTPPWKLGQKPKPRSLYWRRPRQIF